jgi:hypothetical protein
VEYSSNVSPEECEASLQGIYDEINVPTIHLDKEELLQVIPEGSVLKLATIVVLVVVMKICIATGTI